MFNLKEKGLTTPEKFVAWWNGNNPDFQITVDSIEEWTYRKDEDPSRYNCHWGEYGDQYSVTYTRVQAFFNEAI